MFFKILNSTTTLKESNFFNTFTDYHSHILPGVDDGVKTMKESLKLLSLYEELGVRELWCTPHIMEDIPNTTNGLKQRLSDLKEAYNGKIKLNLASEYMLDNLFAERLEDDDLLTLGKEGNHLLVETSYFNPPMGLYETLEHIKSKGYYPVLAHPERYTYMGDKDYIKLKKMGLKFQMNIPSLAGMYGKTVKKKCEWLMKGNYYDLSGSDTHRIEHILMFSNSKIEKKKILKCLDIHKHFKAL